MPPLLIVGGISGAGMVTVMERFRPLLMVVTFGLLGFAFYLTYRPRAVASSGTSKVMAMNKVMLWAVTVVAALFLFFPQYFTAWASGDRGFTADMQRSVLLVEGMTCPG